MNSHMSESSTSTMMEEIARVVDYQQGWVTVEVELKSACNHCASSENCGTSTIAKAFSVHTQRFSLPSERPCHSGDLLKIGLPESVIIKAGCLGVFIAVNWVVFIGNDRAYAGCWNRIEYQWFCYGFWCIRRIGCLVYW